jgi:regulator of Ty1 transposition protein 109
LEQFWETMAFRSECSSGRLVGFIWLVFTPPALEDDVDVDESTATIPAAAPGTDPTANHSQTSTSSLASLSITLQPTTITAAPPRSPTRRRAPLTGPIIPRLPRIKSTSSTTHPHNLPPPSSRHYSWPSTSRGTLVLADKEYEKATEMLLRLDFAARGAAAASTRTWVDEVGVLAGGSSSAGDAGRGGGMEEAVSWSRRVVGRNTAAAVAAGSVVSGENSIANGDGHDDGARTALAAPAVNVLGVKRKADEERTLPSSLPSGGGTANVLGAGLVRKKPKRVQPVAVVGGGGI